MRNADASNAPDPIAHLKDWQVMCNLPVTKRQMLPQMGRFTSMDVNLTSRTELDAIDQYGFIEAAPPKPRIREVDKGHQ